MYEPTLYDSQLKSEFCGLVFSILWESQGSFCFVIKQTQQNYGGTQVKLHVIHTLTHTHIHTQTHTHKHTHKQTHNTHTHNTYTHTHTNTHTNTHTHTYTQTLMGKNTMYTSTIIVTLN